MKCTPETTHKQFTEIYNTMAETSDATRKITYRILKPLQKPNKAKGPPSNLRPIVIIFSP